jgi:hypothetical protein
MKNLPQYIPLVFVFTSLLTVLIFFLASRSRVLPLLIILGLLAIQALLSLSGFFTVTNVSPPRFPLLLGPPLVMILGLFFTKKGRIYMNSFDLRLLTLLHVIRIPVEIVLYWLCLQKAVPELMTFEGRNFDIVSGITAPLMVLLCFRHGSIKRSVLLIWNFICLALLVNVVFYAVLSAPFPFQRFAFDQPNIAVLYFPFVWLPGMVVPIVLLSHLIAIRKLITKQQEPDTVYRKG